MRAARLFASDDPDEALFRRRAVSLVLTILAHIGLLLLLLSLTPERVFAPMAPPSGPLTVTLNPAEEQQAAASKPKTRPTKATAKAAAKPATTPPPPPVPPPLPQPESKALSGVLYLSKNDLETADISKLPQGQKQADAGGGGAPGDTPVTGTGRQGQPLYAAEWVREPTDAEINGYVHRRMADDSWAVIACQTVARNRVDDCYVLGDSPGSNLANEMVEASWQFLVRPPRVGGKVLVGTWVSIRIDLRVRRSG